MLSQIDEVALTSLMEDVPSDCEADIDDLLEVPVGLELP